MRSHGLMTIAINNNHCRLVDNPVHPVVFGHDLNTVAFDTRNIATSTALVQALSHAWQLDPINFIPNNKLNIRRGHSTTATLVTACQPLDCNFASMSLNSKHLMTSCRKVRLKSRYDRPFTILSFMQSPVRPVISAIIRLQNTCLNRSAFALRNFRHNTYAPGYTF